MFQFKRLLYEVLKFLLDRFLGSRRSDVLRGSDDVLRGSDD